MKLLLCKRLLLFIMLILLNVIFSKKLIAFHNYSFCDIGSYIYHDMKVEFLNTKNLYFCLDLEGKRNYFSEIQDKINGIYDSNNVKNIDFNEVFCKSVKNKVLTINEIDALKYKYSLDDTARKGFKIVVEWQEKQNALMNQNRNVEDFNNSIYTSKEWHDLQKERDTLYALPEVKHYYKLKAYQTPVFVYIVGVYRVAEDKIIVLLKHNTSPHHKFRELSMIGYVFNLQPKSDKEKRVEKIYW